MSKNTTSFPEGKSGNPAGRPKGSKNRITILKESLELQLREASASRMPEVLDRAFEMALEGDRAMIKLLVELHMSKGIAQEKNAPQEKVEINISTNSPTPKDEPKFVNAESVLEHRKEKYDNGK